MGQSRSVTWLPRWPLLSTPSLADTMADQVDDRAVQLLLQLALTKKKSEEEREERRRQEEVAEHERRMRVLDRRIAADEQLTPEESREGRGRGRRGGNANFQNPLPQFADVPVLFSDKFQQSKKFEFMVPQTQFFDDVWDTLVVQQRQVRGFLVQKTVVVPQLQFIAGRQHPLRAADADPHGPVCSADQGDSTVAAYLVVDVPVAGSCRFSGAAVEKPLALPQLQLVEKSVIFSVPLYLAVTCTVFVFAFGGQEYGFSGR